MTNPVFDNQPQPGNMGIFGLIKQLRDGDPKATFDRLYESNPQFRDFANSMKDKPIEQAYQEKGFDYNQFKGLMRK